jgi:hypothetical protein
VSSSLNSLEPWLVPWSEWLVSLIAPYGAKVTSVRRSKSEQLRLWNTRHTNPYPVAPPGHSYHEYGRAFDVVAPAPVLAWAGAVWRQVGGTWSANDPIHFQA